MADNFILYWILPLLSLEWKILSLFNISLYCGLSNKFLQGSLFLPLHTAGPPGWVPPGSATYTPGPHPGTGYCKWILCVVYSGIRTTCPLDNLPQTTRPRSSDKWPPIWKHQCYFGQIYFYAHKVIISWKKKKVCFFKYIGLKHSERKVEVGETKYSKT